MAGRQWAFTPHDFHPKDTQRLYEDSVTQGHYNDARTALHNRIIKHTLKTGKPSQRPYAIIIAGGPTSGKSTLIAALRRAGVLPNSDGIVTINKKPFSELPEYSKYPHSRHPEKTLRLVDEYWDLLCYMIEEAAKKKMPMIIEEHCDDVPVVKEIAAILSRNGYETALIGMTTTPDAYFEHERERCKKTDKSPDHPWALECHTTLAEEWGKYIKLFDFSLLMKRNAKGPPLSVISNAERSPDASKVTHSIIDEGLYHDLFQKWKSADTLARGAKQVFSEDYPSQGRKNHRSMLERSGEGSGSGRKETGKKETITPGASFVEKLKKFGEQTSQRRND